MAQTGPQSFFDDPTMLAPRRVVKQDLGGGAFVLVYVAGLALVGCGGGGGDGGGGGGPPPALDIATNMFLGREIVCQGALRPFLDIRRMEAEARKLLSRLKINIPSIRQKVRSMSGGQRQSIAIARSVYFNAKVVILDEPTAALGVEETRKVHELVREMRSHGLAVLMISHNLNHVFENSDRITVLKTGRVVGSRRVADTSREEILRMIVTGTAEGHAAPRAAQSVAV